MEAGGWAAGWLENRLRGLEGRGEGLKVKGLCVPSYARGFGIDFHIRVALMQAHEAQ